MKTMLENNRLVLCPEGRIDSTNAPTMEAEMLAALKANPGAEVSIDAGELTYISSAGLRVFMKLLKQREGRLPVVNVSPEVYDILEVTGFTELFDVKKRRREISVEGCELIGSGAYGKVYRLDRETIAKIYAPTISLSPYSLLIMSFHATTISEDRAMLEARVNHLVRGRLLPAIDEAQPLDF